MTARTLRRMRWLLLTALIIPLGGCEFSCKADAEDNPPCFLLSPWGRGSKAALGIHMSDLLLQGIYWTNKTRSVLFYTIIVLTLVSIAYPWRIRNLFSRLFLHIPIFIVWLFLYYQSNLVPRTVSIRVDLLVLYPCIGLVMLSYLIKLVRGK